MRLFWAVCLVCAPSSLVVDGDLETAPLISVAWLRPIEGEVVRPAAYEASLRVSFREPKRSGLVRVYLGFGALIFETTCDQPTGGSCSYRVTLPQLQVGSHQLTAVVYERPFALDPVEYVADVTIHAQPLSWDPARRFMIAPHTGELECVGRSVNCTALAEKLTCQGSQCVSIDPQSNAGKWDVEFNLPLLAGQAERASRALTDYMNLPHVGYLRGLEYVRSLLPGAPPGARAPRRFVALVLGDDVDSTFHLPAVTMAWRHAINYEPVLLLSGRPWKRAIDNFDKRAETPEELALHAIIESRSVADIIPIEPPELLDKGPGWLRALGLAAAHTIGERFGRDVFVLLADPMLLPLSPAHFNQRDWSKHATFYNPFGYSNVGSCPMQRDHKDVDGIPSGVSHGSLFQHELQLPLEYIGAFVHAWHDFVPLQVISASAQSHRQCRCRNCDGMPVIQQFRAKDFNECREACSSFYPCLGWEWKAAEEKCLLYAHPIEVSSETDASTISHFCGTRHRLPRDWFSAMASLLANEYRPWQGNETAEPGIALSLYAMRVLSRLNARWRRFPDNAELVARSTWIDRLDVHQHEPSSRFIDARLPLQAYKVATWQRLRRILFPLVGTRRLGVLDTFSSRFAVMMARPGALQMSRIDYWGASNVAELFDAYEEFRREMCAGRRKPKYLVARFEQCGWGHLSNEIAPLLLFAILSKRAVVFDWSRWRFNPSVFLGAEAAEWDLSQVQHRCPGFRGLERSHLGDFVWHHPDQFPELHSEIAVLSTDKELYTAHWQLMLYDPQYDWLRPLLGMHTFHIMGKLFRHFLNPSPALKAKLLPFAERLRDRFVVSVQLRAQHFSLDLIKPNQQILVEILKCAAAIRPGRNDSAFFVMTDNMELLKLARSMLPGLVISFPEEFGKPQHLETAQTADQAERTFLDWFMFGEFSHIGVIPYSTNFGYSAVARVCPSAQGDKRLCKSTYTPITVAEGDIDICMQRVKQEARFCPFYGN